MDLYIFAVQLNNFLWALIGGFLGAIIAIFIQKYQEPKLDIIATEKANSDNTYPHGHSNSGRWKFFRVYVINKPVNKLLYPFIMRETAQQVSAVIKFHEINQEMKGRWAGTLELVQANPADYIKIINFPDPINLISGGVKEELDIFTKSANDTEAYGWNNEAYIHHWRNPRLKMITGNFRVEVNVTAIDGSQVSKIFKAHIANTIEDTYLRSLNE